MKGTGVELNFSSHKFCNPIDGSFQALPTICLGALNDVQLIIIWQAFGFGHEIGGRTRLSRLANGCFIVTVWKEYESILTHHAPNWELTLRQFIVSFSSQEYGYMRCEFVSLWTDDGVNCFHWVDIHLRMTVAVFVCKTSGRLFWWVAVFRPNLFPKYGCLYKCRCQLLRSVKLNDIATKCRVPAGTWEMDPVCVKKFL